MAHTFEQIEEEIQTILDSFGDVEIGEAHDESEELSEEQKAALDQYLEELGTEEKQKVDAFAQFCRMSDAQIKALRTEAARLESRARSRENTVKFLKSQYLGIMEKHGTKKIAGDMYTMSRRATKVCVIDDEQLIPADYITVKTTIAPAKKDILFSLKTGTPVPGCHMGESYSLSIR